MKFGSARLCNLYHLVPMEYIDREKGVFEGSRSTMSKRYANCEYSSHFLQETGPVFIKQREAVLTIPLKRDQDITIIMVVPSYHTV